jgi:hypothetical protein
MGFITAGKLGTSEGLSDGRGLKSIVKSMFSLISKILRLGLQELRHNGMDRPYPDFMDDQNHTIHGA